MDVQGAELGVLRHGPDTLADCLAVQLEVSFVPLYEGQPPFGEVDLFMRAAGFLPHRFVHMKRWSIAPTVFNGDVRQPGNQLLETDIVYVRDPLEMQGLSGAQLAKLAALAHYVFRSPDYCVRLLLELVKRGQLRKDASQHYMRHFKSFG